MDYVLMLFGSFGACIHVCFVLDLSWNCSLYISMDRCSILDANWWDCERQTARLRLKYLQSVLRKDIDFFDTEARDTNIIFHISSDAILVQDAIGDKLTLLTLAVFPLIALAGGDYTIVMSSLSEKGEAAYAEAGKVAEEVISQIRTVYSFVGEDKAIETYSQSLLKALKLGEKGGLAKGCRPYIWTVVFALGQATPNLAAISKGRAAAANIMKMIESDSNSSKVSDKGVVLPKVSGHIVFSNVCFAYPSRPNMVGLGKSTIISMVQRFYNPSSGNILLDRHDVSTLQLRWLHEQMGLVSQELALFATTIADNILLGKEDADMDGIIEAAKAANAHSFIQGLPDGYKVKYHKI
ncbi:putative xenobiotic-transporting ATPase [Rosa chinensis]|uniref:Putative xenobiotic-transporting ATPase n=1 Tax=Rosa chinensis TaxID=74649 RepID=A0A2P6PZ95_ROSCH|nr:putative xenobiotic-transporting ATPase [Rosa chinensis]